MSRTAFNLADEAWIRVMLPDCTVREVSLTEALTEAHQFKGLAGEMEAQNVAVLRLLIALAHTVFTRVNPDGEEDPVEDRRTALERWAALMKNGYFPEKPIKDYLIEWHERFWLFHPEQPFFQFNDAKASGKTWDVSKLNGEISESGNKVRLFPVVSGESKTKMGPPEAARWLLFICGFDDLAVKKKVNGSSFSSSVGWLGRLGVITASGSNLFETIMLNMTMLMDGEAVWEEDDYPIWERDGNTQTTNNVIPKNLAAVLTIQNRHVLLQYEEGFVTGYWLLSCDSPSTKNAFQEQMTLWKSITEKETGRIMFVPVEHKHSKQIWREFGSIMNYSPNEHRPGVVSWCSYLQNHGFVSHNRLIWFRTFCVRYDVNMFGAITDSFSDIISFHADLFMDQDGAWVREINNQVSLVEQAADLIGKLAVNLAKACGQYTDGSKRAKERLNEIFSKAGERLYLAIDLPFRDWLLKLRSDQGADERNGIIVVWKNQARSIALSIALQIVQQKGDIAFVGRTVTEKKKDHHYSAPEAYRWFKSGISQIYPFTQEGDEQHG